MAKSEQVNIDLTAKDEASKVIDKVADAAEDLEKLSPEVDITADGGSATTEIDGVATAARQLSAADAEIVLRAKVDAAKSDLASLRSELDQTGEKAETTARQLDRVGGDAASTGGIQTRGNAIADLTGPLGEASGAASDFAGVFDGLGDIATDVAAKLGASDKMVAGVGAAMGGLGIVVAGAAAAWQLYQSHQKKAREEAEKILATTRKLNDALDDQNAREWAESFAEGFPDAIKAANGLGVAVSDATKFITGQSDAIPGLVAAQSELQAAFVDAGLSQADAAAKTELTTQKIIDAREAYASGRTEVGKLETDLSRIASAMPGWGRDTDTLTDSTEELTEATEAGAKTIERAGRAHEIAQAKIDATGAAYDRLRGKLDIEDAVGAFNEAWLLAVDAVQRGTDDADARIHDLKGAYLDLSETVGANPTEVAVTFDTIDADDLLHVKASAENYFRQNPIMATVKASGATVSGGGGGSVRPTMVPIGPDGGGGAAPVMVTMNVPRGYRGDLLSDARRSSRRSGRYYQRAGR